MSKELDPILDYEMQLPVGPPGEDLAYWVQECEGDIAHALIHYAEVLRGSADMLLRLSGVASTISALHCEGEVIGLRMPASLGEPLVQDELLNEFTSHADCDACNNAPKKDDRSN